MWRRDRARRQHERQARIRELERELEIEPGPEIELTRLIETIKLLSTRREEIQAASESLSSEDLQQALANVERQLWQAIKEVEVTNQTLRSRFPQQSRVGRIEVRAEGKHQWLVQVRSVENETGEEKVRELRLVGRRHRKMMELLSRPRIGDDHQSAEAGITDPER